MPGGGYYSPHLFGLPPTVADGFAGLRDSGSGARDDVGEGSLVVRGSEHGVR